MSRRETGRLTVQLHFIVERCDSQFCPWHVLDDASSCEDPDYPIREDIRCFESVWPLPEETNAAEIGDRFEIRGDAKLVFEDIWTDGGTECDAHFEDWSVTCLPTDEDKIAEVAEK